MVSGRDSRRQNEGQEKRVTRASAEVGKEVVEGARHVRAYAVTLPPSPTIYE